MKNIIDDDDDFGFSAISVEEYEARITKAVKNAEYEASSLTADQYRAQLLELEKVIIPFLTKLRDTGDKEYIFWPNRGPILDKQIEKVLKLTRG
jgi:hypothetical protein